MYDLNDIIAVAEQVIEVNKTSQVQGRHLTGLPIAFLAVLPTEAVLLIVCVIISGLWLSGNYLLLGMKDIFSSK